MPNQILMVSLFLGAALAMIRPSGPKSASAGNLKDIAGNASAASDSKSWNALVDEYFEEGYFKFRPTEATDTGLHQYDSQLENYTRAGVEKNIEVLHQYEKRFEAFDPKGLNETEFADRDFILSKIRGRLLTLEVIRPWEKDPDTYTSGVTQGAYVIMKRKFAPPDERLRLVVDREKLMPAVFVAARQNLANPPRLFTEIALDQLPGIISFFQKDLPLAFADAKDAKTKADFAESNAAVIAALGNFGEWMKADLLPRSKGDYRIGAGTYSKKLLYDEMVDTPLDRLLEIGWADLHKNQAEFNRVAHEVDPHKTPREVLKVMDADHPAPDKLIDAFRGTFNGLIAFIQQNHIIAIPTDVRPIVQETPPFRRATTFASMDTPGPFEKVAKEAYFNVTLPGPHDTLEQIEGRMAGFNRSTIISVSTHEAYPGHYVQFLWTPDAPSKTRMILAAATNAEGWAHYCEQMMLDEGYGQPGVGAMDERQSKLIRLGQLQDALLRDARFVVGIQMHRGKMTFEEAVDFFTKEGYQSREVGSVETKRGASDPTYLYYTLGKLEIMKLRADLKQKQGAAFSLEKFHTDFMKQGAPPIKIVRQALLGDSSPAL